MKKNNDVKGYNIAIAGATGAVGLKMIDVLEISRLKILNYLHPHLHLEKSFFTKEMRSLLKR